MGFKVSGLMSLTSLRASPFSLRCFNGFAVSEPAAFECFTFEWLRRFNAGAVSKFLWANARLNGWRLLSLSKYAVSMFLSYLQEVALFLSILKEC